MLYFLLALCIIAYSYFFARYSKRWFTELFWYTDIAEYSTPSCRFYWLFVIKKTVVTLLLTLRQRATRRRQRIGKESLWRTLIPTKEARLQDAPQNLDLMPSKLLANDAIAFQGCDQQGNQLLIRFGRRTDSEAEIWLILRLVDKATGSSLLLCHPEHPKTTLFAAKAGCWEAGGLRCEVREPMRRWRLSYNGWLRKCSSGSWKHSADESDLLHVRFSFVWTALSDVFDFNTDLSPTLTANSLCREHWCKEFFENLRKTHEDRYEQWGQMLGSVTVDNSDSKELVLRGMRDHCYGLRDWSRYARYTANMGYTEDGTFFHVGGVCIPKGTTNLIYGYVGLNSGELVPVDQCSLDLSQLGHEAPPEKFSISFTAGGLVYAMEAKVHTEVQVYNGREWPSKSHLRFVTLSLNGKPGQGFSEFEYRNPTGRPSNFKLPERAVLIDEHREYVPQSLRDVLVLPLTHIVCQVEELCGGKARQLAQLTRIQDKFIVPNGVCVTANAFQLFLKNSKNLLTSVQQLTENRNDQHLAALCSQLQDDVLKHQIPEQVSLDIQSQLQRIFGSDWQQIEFAVRSSAVGEDSALSSAAGQMDTILGVNGLAQIMDALLRCWASVFSQRAVMYRRQYGQATAPSCGVVIQRLVPAESAGVLFTCDPVTGHPGRVVINASYGLGESVVSGEVEPDTVVVARSYEDKVHILNTVIGAKNGSPTSKSFERIGADQLCLTEPQILDLVTVGIEVEKYYGNAIDIEWAYAKGNLYLLQVRPVTTMLKQTELEVIHEFDTGVRSNVEYSTTANVGEVMGGVITPLGVSIVLAAVDKAIQLQMVRNGIRKHVHADIMPTYTLYANQVMLNLSQTMYRDSAVAAHRKVSELCVLGQPVKDENLDRLLKQQADAIPKWRRMFNLIKVFRMIFSASKFRRDAIHNYANFDLPTHDNSAQSIYAAIHACLPAYCDAWFCHVANSGYSGFWYHVIMGILARGDWNTETCVDVARLYSSCSQVVSADVPAALENLAHVLASNTLEQSFCQMSPKAALLWLKSPESGKNGQEFRNFLEKHGHRCIQEIDFYERSWSEDPEQIVPILQNLLQAKDHRVVKQGLEAEEAIKQLKTPLSAVEKAVLRWAVPKAREAVGAREQTKSLAIKVGHAVRKGYRQLGTALVQEGKLPDSDLLYFLTHSELGEIVTEPSSPALIIRANMRRKMRSVQAEILLPHIAVGYPAADTVHTAESASEIGSTQLLGTPVSSGKVRAKVWVAKTLADAQGLEKGSILVAHSTDIAWSVYFPLLSGVVTELGGLLSHGAVVAREYGLPCLVSVKRATDVFATGDLALLDAEKGTITKIDA